MGSRPVPLRLSPEDRRLVLRYGYPFEELEKQLKKHESTPRTVVIDCDFFEYEHLVADLSRSIRQSEDDELRESLDVLCERIEAAVIGR